MPKGRASLCTRWRQVLSHGEPPPELRFRALLSSLAEGKCLSPFGPGNKALQAGRLVTNRNVLLTGLGWEVQDQQAGRLGV